MSKKHIISLCPNPDGFGQIPDELETSMFASSLPTQHSHMVFEDDDIGLYVGLWDTSDMIEAAGAYECDEFMLVLEGRAAIKQTDKDQLTHIDAGQTFVIPKGLPCQWHQQGYLRKFFMIWQHPEQDIPQAPAHDGVLLDGQPYQDNTKAFTSGILDKHSLNTELAAQPSYQMIVVKQGTLYVIDNEQEKTIITANGAVFIEQATLCYFDASDDLVAHFAQLSLPPSITEIDNG